MRHRPLSRRTLLRSLGGSLGGTAIGLPLLEAMMDNRAFALSPAPVRYVVVFCGMPVGSDEATGENELFIPNAQGILTAPLKLALEPLEAFKSDLTIVSNLSIPRGDNGSNIPAAGRGGTAGFHTETIGPLVSGMRSTSGTDPERDAQGPSHDFIMSELIGGATQFPLLATRVQASQYGGHLTHVTWRGAETEEVAIVSPQAVFDKLFANGLPSGEPPSDTGPTLAQLAALRAQERRLDVVQRVSLATDRLSAQLGGYDQRRLQEHLEALRTLEGQVVPTLLGGTPAMASTGACVLPASPGADPAQGSSYSGEEERALAMFDLAHLALACDLTRVVSINMSAGMSLMEVPTAITGIDEANQNDLHELGHSETDRAHALGVQWHTRHLARFLGKLKDTPDTSGTLLDNTVVLFLTEAGSGADAPHNSDGMAVVYAGGAGGRLRVGEHFDGAGAHPTQVIISAMQAAGYSGSTLGEVMGGFAPILI